MSNYLQGIEWLKRGNDLLKRTPRVALAYFNIALDLMDPDSEPDLEPEQYRNTRAVAWRLKGTAINQCDNQSLNIERFFNTDRLRWEIQCYEEAIRLDSNQISARASMASSCITLGWHAEATENLQAILDLDRADALEPQVTAEQIYSDLAVAYFNIGNVVRARDVVRQAQLRGIDSKELRHLGRLEEVDLTEDNFQPLVLDYTGGPLSKILSEVECLIELDLDEDARTVLDDIRFQYGPTTAAETIAYRERMMEQISNPDPIAPSIPPKEKIDTVSDVLCTWASAQIDEGKIDAQQMIESLDSISPNDARADALKRSWGSWYAAQEQYESALLTGTEIQTAERNPILELAERHTLIKDEIIEELCRQEIARRITDRSINAVTDYLLWRLDNLPEKTPPPDSQELFLGFLVGSPLLFSVDLGILPSLENHQIPPTLRAAFEDNGKPLSDNVTVTAEQQPGTTWLLFDDANDKMYRITKAEDHLGVHGEVVGARDLMKARRIGSINYHAAHLHAKTDETITDETIARATYVLAQVYSRLGMIRVALALLNKVANRINGKNENLLVACYTQIAKFYNRQQLHGKAWNYVAAGLPLAQKVSPVLRGHLWDLVAQIMYALHRYNEAARFFQKIADMPEAAQLPPPMQTGDGSVNNLEDYARLSLFGVQSVAQGAIVPMVIPPYASLRPGGQVRLSIRTPDAGLLGKLLGKQFYMSSYHELFDELQRVASQLLTVRHSISWRGSVEDYLREWAELLEALVQTAFKISLPHRALEWIEAVKTSILVQRLALATGQCPKGVDPKEWKRLEKLIQQYRECVEAENQSVAFVESNSESITPVRPVLGLTIEELEEAIRRLTSELRYKHPHLPYTFGRFNVERGLPDRGLENLPPNTWILEYFCDTNGGGCFLINPDNPRKPEWVKLEGLTPSTVETKAKAFWRMLSEYRAGKVSIDTVNREVTNAINYVRTVALEPLLEKRDDYLSPETTGHIVIIPHRALHTFPFHAAIDPADNLVVSYAPSLTVLSRLRRPESEMLRGVIATDSLGDLQGARVGGEYTKNFLERHGYHVESAYGTRATVDWLEEQIQHANIFHASTHAHFDAETPNRSGLAVSPEGLWTLQRLWQHANLSKCQLAFLAGCNTSMTKWQDAVEESLGLPGGFIQAGATTVIGSLWTTYDLPTLFLTYQFYRLLLDGKYSPAQALTSAQYWLATLTVDQILDDLSEVLKDYYKCKYGVSAPSPEHALEISLKISLDTVPGDSTRFDSPYFWAPFQCIGLP